MGNHNQSPRLPKIQWEKVDIDNGIEIYRNKANNQLAEKRFITLNEDFDIQEELKVYNMRERNNDALVRSLGTQNMDKSQGANLLCAGKKKICVYTEKMPHRLSECPQLTFPQCLLFLRESLRGFERIYRDYGPVQVTKQLIGINYLGQVKSWLNDNWALNHRSHEYSNLGQTKLSQLTRSQYLSYRGEYMDEQEMVRNIISVIEKKCEQGQFPQAFKQEVENQSSSFRKLLLYLKDFIEFNNIYVPETIDYQTLLQNNYQKRFEYQLNHQAGNKSVVNNNTGNNNNFKSSQGQFGYSAANQLNGDLTKYMQQNTQYSNGYQFNGQYEGFKSDTNKQSPASDMLGKITFSQSNRIYTGDNKIAHTQWPPKTEGAFSSSAYQLNNNNFNANNLNTNKTSNVESKYEFYSSQNYKPSYQMSTFESSFQPTKYESSYNGLNSGNANLGQSASQYSYNYSSSYNNGTVGNIDSNSTYLSNQGASSNFIAGSLSNNYGVNPSTGYESAYKPSITMMNSTQTQPISTYQTNTWSTEQTKTKVQQENKNPKTLEEFRKIADNSNQIDGKTGEKVSQTITSSSNTYTAGPQKNYQNPEVFGYNNSKQQTQTVSNKWTSSMPISAIQTYKNSSYSSYNPSLPNPSSETISTYSFGSKIQQESQFGSAYHGTGYSNTLTKYEPSNNTTLNGQFQGKYAEAFSNLLSQSLQQNFASLKNENLNTTPVQINNRESPASQPKSQNQSPIVSKQQGITIQNRVEQSQNKVFQEFSNLVERASNDVSESILKQF